MRAKITERELRLRHVGIFLRESRERAGRTQGEVARALKYSTPQFVSNWERGISLPPFDVLPRLIHVLEIKPKAMMEALRVYQDELFKLRKAELSRLFRALE
jgi:transcriptional regulator with XRE-family HTH domain